MDKTVYRDGIPCKLVKNGWRVTVWESKDHDTQFPIEGAEGGIFDLSVLRGPVGGWHGTGQREVRISPRVLAVPLDNSGERHLLATCDGLGQDFGVDIDLLDLERRAEVSRRKSAARAKRECRHKIKHGGFRHMLTGTYRENMTDFDRMHRDWAAFLRKLHRLLPRFRTVYGLEPQKRGAWHFHCTIDTPPRYLRHRGELKPSYEVFTLLWQEVVGDVQYPYCGPLQPGHQWPVQMVPGGTINVDGYTRKSRKKKHADARELSLAKMASYVGKYLTKEHGDGVTARRMWGSTQDLTPPKCVSYEFPECSIAEMVGLVFECPPGHRVARHWMNSFKDCYVLDTEPIPP